MMREHTGAVEATGLVKTYPGDVRALDGISLSVQSGSIFGLLGPNGAGKSTTVKVLTTLSHPDSGTARVHPDWTTCAVLFPSAVPAGRQIAESRE